MYAFTVKRTLRGEALVSRALQGCSVKHCKFKLPAYKVRIVVLVMILRTQHAMNPTISEGV